MTEVVLVEEKAEIARTIRIVHVTHTHMAAVRPADGRASDLATAKTSSNAAE